MAPRISTDTDQTRVANLLRIYGRAARVFGNKTRAEVWLRSSLPELDGRTPLTIAQTGPGAALIETILGRIARGEMP